MCVEKFSIYAKRTKFMSQKLSSNKNITKCVTIFLTTIKHLSLKVKFSREMAAIMCKVQLDFLKTHPPPHTISSHTFMGGKYISRF
jgi:hypothetical protein